MDLNVDRHVFFNSHALHTAIIAGDDYCVVTTHNPVEKCGKSEHIVRKDIHEQAHGEFLRSVDGISHVLAAPNRDAQLSVKLL